VAAQSRQGVSQYGYLWRDLDNAANHVRLIVVMRLASLIPPRRVRGRATQTCHIDDHKE
jgi:hypothetical protein